MATLCRSAAGDFNLDISHTIGELEELTLEEREKLLMPIESLFSDLPAITLPAFYERLSRSGCEIYQKKIHTSFEIGQRVRLYGENRQFYALGQVGEYKDGSAVKSIKMFDI